MTGDVNVDTGMYIDRLKAQRNMLADDAAMSSAAVKTLQQENAELRRTIEGLKNALVEATVKKEANDS